MIKKAFFRRRIFIPAIIVAGFLVLNISFAYDSHNTHRALTYESAQFYNYYASEKLTEQEIKWLMQGAQEEDTPPRWINHFYNPITGEGWKGKNFGGADSNMLLWFSKFILSSRSPLSAKNWANNQSAQTDYENYKGNQTWQKAIESFNQGDKKSAYIALGHILHLIEDMTVPEHTRGDTHAGLIVDKGSPYENWAKNYTAGKIKSLQIAELLKNQSIKPKDFAILESYFDWNAKYSSENFVSEDTIKQIKNVKYEMINDNEYYALNVSNGDSFPLYFFQDKVFTTKDDRILTAYWERLSKRAVISSAGVLQLFHKEAEQQKNFAPKHSPKSQITRSQIFSPFGGLAKFHKSITDFASSIFGQKSEAEIETGAPIVAESESQGSPQAEPEQQTSPQAEPEEPTSPNAEPEQPPAQQAEPEQQTSPQAEPEHQTQTSPQAEPEQPTFYVSRVIDGDTFVLNNGKSVRLIGIDAPEYKERCFDESKQKLSNILLGKEIRLQKDTSETDKYNRLLRYVYINNSFVNAEMIKGGYATALSIYPDTKYAQTFKMLEDDAQTLGLGCLFAKDEPEAEADKAQVEENKYLGWSSAGGSSKPQPQAESEYQDSSQAESEIAASTGMTGGGAEPEQLTPTSTQQAEPETSTSTPQAEPEQQTPTSTPQAEPEQQTSTSTPQAEPESPGEKIIINEIQLAGQTSKDEFIELYNPNVNSVDISDWRLTKKTASGTESNLVSKFSSQTIIPGQTHFLITHKTDYQGIIPSDTTYSGASYSIANNNTIILKNASSTIIDKVGLGTAQDFEGASAENPPTSQSITRKSHKDSDNNSEDFEITNPTPQNSAGQIGGQGEELEEQTPTSTPQAEQDYTGTTCQVPTYGTHKKYEGKADRTKAEGFPNFLNSLTVTLEANKTYYANDTIIIPEKKRLIIEEGVVLKFGQHKQKAVRAFAAELLIQGDLEINGTAENPVIFTTFRDDVRGVPIEISQTDPAPGDWGSLSIQSGNGKSISIQNAEFYYGGSIHSSNRFGGAISINSSEADILISNIKVMHSWSGIYSNSWPSTQPQITNSIFEMNGLWGIANEKDKHIKIVGNTFKCNGLYGNSGTTGGISTEGNPENIIISDNRFLGNENTGLNFYNDDFEIELKAEDNFWDAPSGPYHATKNPGGAGDTAQGNIDFTPYK